MIALGTPGDPDAALLREIAHLGGGRAYFTADAMQLPRVFAEDVMHVARKTFLEQRTRVLPARGLFSLQVARPPTCPTSRGYNLTFLASGAEPMLASGDENAAPLAAGAGTRCGQDAAPVTFEADGAYTGELAALARVQGLLPRRARVDESARPRPKASMRAWKPKGGAPR